MLLPRHDATVSKRNCKVQLLHLFEVVKRIPLARQLNSLRMADIGEFKIIARVGVSGIISVDFDTTKYNRQSIAPFSEGVGKTVDLEEQVDRIWKSRVKENSKLFNGSKFRFFGVSESCGNIQLKLGLTDYRAFQGDLRLLYTLDASHDVQDQFLFVHLFMCSVIKRVSNVFFRYELCAKLATY